MNNWFINVDVDVVIGVGRVQVSVQRAPTAIMNKPLHPVTREADMEVPFLLKEMLS